jgi:serine/threonine-protein kinase
MPYVEGESLRDRLDRERQLPVDEAVRLTGDVADALDYAHRHGVIHRDIKPANILLHDGRPLVADFGIALAISAAGGGRLTETGLSLGTPHYMSPEQATGDQRVGGASDIWALGCMLFEMLAGEPPYTGSTAQAVLGRIITADPPSATAERRSVPPHVDAAIRRALEKLPADRFASASDLAKALADPSFRHGAEHVVGGASRVPWRPVAIGFAASTVALALLGAWSVYALLHPRPRAPARFDVTPDQVQELAASVGDVLFAISPDGSWFVYVGTAPGGGTQLWRRAVGDLTAVPIPGTEGARAPTVSPDGTSIAFLMLTGAMRTLSLEGGSPFTVAAAGGGPAWGSDGMIYFARDGIVQRVPETGGEPVTVTERSGNMLQRLVSVLPDGRGLLMTVLVGTPAQARIGVVGPEGGAVREILTGTMARYAATGHILYATAGGVLMAAPFDLRSLTVTGPSVALAEGLEVNSNAASQLAISASGTLLYRTGTQSDSELVWVGRDGDVSLVDPDWTGEFGSPAISPDGTRVAVAVQGATSMDIWVKQLDRGPSTRVTLDGGRNDFPAWTPDGASVTFTSDRRSESFDLWTKRADGSGEPVLEVDEERAIGEALWSPDGQWLIHRTSGNERGSGDILGRRGGSEGERVGLVASDFAELSPTFSPDGRWMAYSSNETGREEIFVVPFPNTSDARWAVSIGGGREPLWSRDGHELFYRAANADLVAVPVRTETVFAAGTPTVLFSSSGYRLSIFHRQYDVTPDGERFVFIRRLGATRESRLILVQNFSQELERRVPN